MDWVNNMGHYFVFGEVTGALICQSSPSSHTSHNIIIHHSPSPSSSIRHSPSSHTTVIKVPSHPLIFTSFTIYQGQHQIEHHHHHLLFNVRYASSYLCSLPQPPQCPMLSNPLQCTTSMFSLACLVSGDLAFPPKQLFPMPHHLLFTALPNVSLYPLLFTALPNFSPSPLFFKCQYTSLLFSCPGSSFLSVTNK